MEVQNMAGHLVRRLHQVSTQLFNARVQAAGFDLTSVQFAALDAIRAHPMMDQAGIAAQIAYDRATIGGVIDRLEQKGLVTRIVSKKDRRAREVSLTSQGQATLDALFPIVSALQPDIIAGLAPDEQETFLRLAQKALTT